MNETPSTPESPQRPGESLHERLLRLKREQTRTESAPDTPPDALPQTPTEPETPEPETSQSQPPNHYAATPDANPATPTAGFEEPDAPDAPLESHTETGHWESSDSPAFANAPKTEPASPQPGNTSLPAAPSDADSSGTYESGTYEPSTYEPSTYYQTQRQSYEKAHTWEAAAAPYEPAAPPARTRLRSYILSREFWLTLVGLISVGALAVILFFNLVLPSITYQNEAVSVPGLVNLSLDEATRKLEAQGFTYRVDSQYDPTLPPLIVLAQAPQDLARVKPGRRIQLVVNKVQPPTVKLPKLTNVDLQQVRYLLESWGLKIGEMTFVQGAEANIVKKVMLDGRPLDENDPVLVGTALDLVISRGAKPGKVPIPDVEGMPFIDAVTLLQSRGFEVEIPPRFKRSDKVPAGAVSRQLPQVRQDSTADGSLFRLEVNAGGMEEIAGELEATEEASAEDEPSASDGPGTEPTPEAPTGDSDDN